jgi:hypothetical protein
MAKRTGRGSPLLAACALALALTACSGSRHSEAPPPAAADPAIPPRGSGVFAENVVEGEATIETIDRGTRLVTLRNDAGQFTTLKAPADTDLTRIKKGDRVGIAYYESVAIDLAPAGTPLTTETGTAMARAPATELPGRVVGEQVVTTAEVTALDLTNNRVTLRLPDGSTRTIPVRNPELQQRLRNLRVGDIVQFTFTEAIAVQILPRS